MDIAHCVIQQSHELQVGRAKGGLVMIISVNVSKLVVDQVKCTTFDQLLLFRIPEAYDIMLIHFYYKNLMLDLLR